MLEHHTSSEQNLSEPTLQPLNESLSVGQEFGQDVRSESRIEDCLDRVLIPQIGVVPYEARQRRRVEMRAELDTLIAAHTELGSEPAAALEAALQQFEREHSTQLYTQRRTVQVREKTPSTRAATLTALALFGLPYLGDCTHFTWNLWARLFGIEGDGMVSTPNASGTSYMQGMGETWFYRFELFAIPLLAGLLTGLLTRHKAGRGVLNALAILAVPALLLPGMLMGLGYAGITGGVNWLPLPSPSPALCGIGFWAALGYGGAQLGSRLRRKGSALLSQRRRVASSIRSHRRSAIRRRNSDLIVEH